MKISSLMLVAAAFGITAQVMASDKEKSGLSVGDQAVMSGRKMAGTDGKEYSLKSVMGKKGALLLFTCNNCPWVVAWDERLTALAKKADKMGIGVIFVNSNDPGRSPGDALDKMASKGKKLGYDFPYVVDEDSEMALAYGATRTPEAFVVNAKGRIVYHGTIDNNSEDAAKANKHYLADALEAVSKGKDPATSKTKSLGCTIKFPN